MIKSKAKHIGQDIYSHAHKGRANLNRDTVM